MNTCQEDKQIQSGHLYNGGEFNFSLFQQILKFLINLFQIANC